MGGNPPGNFLELGTGSCELDRGPFPIGELGAANWQTGFHTIREGFADQGERCHTLLEDFWRSLG